MFPTMTRMFLVCSLTVGTAWLGLMVVDAEKGFVPSANAQTAPDPRETGAEAVRRRQAEQADKEGESLTGEYWTPFELASAGRCDEAMNDLQVLANRGRGYENAQHALGLCKIRTGSTAEGKEWVERAAQAGLADAQASHLRGYLEGHTDYHPYHVAAKWLYLYETNPLRLAIGTENALDVSEVQAIRGSIPRTEYLRGVQAARNWTPVFWTNTAQSTSE
ncbi:hypothetical protein BN1012_Phect3084 [Candidatus Phaeomarinobacter ectocarpi]|uniref:Sel1 repeat family protein n=1 Tax=Candidatus Phaeomarinibacter ectocarpi TaxID=1458461 RepID=X5MPC5_9HYPH|nr:hypothetical protein [Candidatus Phaeomarinobacter ectocarpi]CDO61296.1 hypothetical protein BN1012_Phect3084 [Candidatus Phaeomarinobacter ectocarpi]